MILRYIYKELDCEALFQSTCRQLNTQMYLVLQGCFIIQHACSTIQQHRSVNRKLHPIILALWYSCTATQFHNTGSVFYFYLFFCAVMERNNVDQTV